MGRKRGKRGRGEGTIYQRTDGTWTGQITVGYDPQTRKQTRKTVYAATERECIEALQKARQEAQEATGAALGAQRVSQALEMWLGQIKHRVRDSSLVKYTKEVERLNHYLGNLPLADLDAGQVMKMFRKMEADQVPTSAAKKAGERLRQACKFMTRLGVLSRNPTEGVYLPKHEAEEIQPLTREQARHLLATARDGKCPMYALWVLALDTGARRGELLALEEDDVDWERGEVFIHQSLRELKGRLQLDELKTKYSRRRVRIAPETVAILQSHARGRSSGPLFASPDGKWLESKYLYRNYWYPALDRAGLPRLRLHDLRHTCATLLLLAGVHVKAVSERLGHSKITITLDTYAHVLPTMQDAVAGVIQDLYWGNCSVGPVAVA
jgi:integrase